MKRLTKVLALVLVIVGGCLPAAALAASSPTVITAASSPTVITGAASSVSDTTAVLHGRINPNGVQTGYTFQYGPTPSFGAVSVSKSAGRGNKGVDVATAIAGLTPGTVYYYEISAVSTAGMTDGATLHFTTTGSPPAAVVTGAAVDVLKSSARPTGIINSNGAQTLWQVQYGLTAPNPSAPSYPYETALVPLAPLVAAPLPVSTEIDGLAPATLFHYRIVAYHANATSYGADATFFTEPDRRPVPRLSPHTTPGGDARSPYVFTTTGELTGAGFIPAVDRCTGQVEVGFYAGRHRLAVVVVPVGGDCRFTATTSFRRTHVKGEARLRVVVSFRGNNYIAPVSKLNHVSAG